MTQLTDSLISSDGSVSSSFEFKPCRKLPSFEDFSAKTRPLGLNGHMSKNVSFSYSWIQIICLFLHKIPRYFPFPPPKKLVLADKSDKNEIVAESVISLVILLKYILFQEVYKERKKRISSTCRKYGLGRFQQTKETTETHQPWLDQRSQLFREMEATAQTPTQNSFMWQKNWHLLYCWIHKVGKKKHIRFLVVLPLRVGYPW